MFIVLRASLRLLNLDDFEKDGREIIHNSYLVENEWNDCMRLGNVSYHVIRGKSGYLGISFGLCLEIPGRHYV